jgi:transposase InsO family protein
VTATHTIRLVDHVICRFRRFGVPVRAVLSDNGPEYVAAGFRAHLTAEGIGHVRIPPRSPNHNAVCERFHGSALQECWRPAFHRRRNRSDYMRGRTPAQMLDNLRPLLTARPPATGTITVNTNPGQEDLERGV